MLPYRTPENFLIDPVEIFLLGAGGTGSEMLDALARMDCALRGLGHPGFVITVYDPDQVSSTNLVRQRFLPGDEGLNKAVVLVHRYNVFLGRQWKAVPEPYEPSSLPSCNLLISCTDSAALRSSVYNTGTYRPTTLWLDTGNDERTGQVVLGHLKRQDAWDPNDGTRLPNMGDLYPEISDNAEQFDADDMPSCSAEEALSRQDWPVNRMVALAASNLLWQMFRHGGIDHHGALIDTASGRISPMPISEDYWRSFGYCHAA